MYTHHHTSSQERGGEKSDILMGKNDPRSAQDHMLVSTPPQSKKRPLAVTEGGLTIDFNNTIASTPSTAATTRLGGDSTLRGNPPSVRLFREDSSASSIAPQTPVYNAQRLPSLREATLVSPLPKLRASATTPTGHHAVYIGGSRLPQQGEEEEEAPVTPQRKPGSSRRSRSPSPPKIDKYRSRCRPMPCDGVPARRLATEFELMLDHAEEQEEEASPATEMTPNFPALIELPRLTFLYSDDEDEDFSSQGSRLGRSLSRRDGGSSVNAAAGQPSTGRSTMVPEEFEVGDSGTPSSSGTSSCMSLRESLLADLEGLFLEMDQYQIPLRVASRNLHSRSAQYAEVEDMDLILQEVVQAHPQQFYIEGNIIHFMQQGFVDVDE